ncbi:hypothetical protein BC938DRAFT_479954 [Jimgerdemannia flammicorona]|uniref:Uncharacterized protein n=1 Tax=Jimgerdemannia flammicorona TaxID=994334 RepID=A0A433R0G2_9FUNG|nr:hypothetical protein BC938DRAFT_479954 [Jimgerdemannia flammicorona]
MYYVDAKKNIIENDFTFNNYLKNAPLSDQDEIVLTFIVRIKGKRAYGEWDANDVIREILHQQYTNITLLPEFDIESHHPTDYLVNVYGIVTTGLEWRFIHWSDTLESPKVVISKPYRCTFNREGMEDAEKVLSIIIRIIHSQAIVVESQIGSSKGIYEEAMKKDNVLRPSRRQRSDKDDEEIVEPEQSLFE